VIGFMKKVVSRLIPILSATLLVLPTTAMAKQVEDPIKTHGNGNTSINLQMNAKWSQFEVNLEGNDGSGKITIIDNNPVFDYVLESSSQNGSLANGDTVVISVYNRGGNIVKTLNYTIEGLGETKAPERVNLYKTNVNLDKTYGAARFFNFSNYGSGSEVYLSNAQKNLGTSERTQIDFYRGTTTDGENPYGNWETRNKVRLGYDSDHGKVWVEVNAEYEYRAEYSTVEDADINAIQFMVLNREPDSLVKLENIKLNGKKLDDTVLIGESSWPKWNLEGALQNAHGNFSVEAELVITGDQPNNEINKVEIMLGRK
jgi:hypothetical protein